MDSYILNKSINLTPPSAIVDESKIWVAVPDSNGLSYSAGKVIFNLDNLACSGSDYFSPSESYIQIPLNLAVMFSSATNNALLNSVDTTKCFENAFIAGLKNGSYNLIDKINFKFAGNELIPLDNFENLKIHYKILTTWSQDNVVKRGDELYFALDDADSTYFHTALGMSNNRLNTAATFDAGLFGMANKGKLQRMKKTSYSYLSTSGILSDNSLMINRRQDYCQLTDNTIAGGHAVHTMNYLILMSIKLSDLHPLFEAMPLVKNPSMYLALQLNVNSIHTHTVNAVGAITGISVTNATNTCPYQLSEVGLTATKKGCSVSAETGTITSQIGVVQAKGILNGLNIVGQSHNTTTCIFNACFVKLNTEDYAIYANPSTAVKMVNWIECYCQSGGGLSSVFTNNSVTQLISGNFSKLRSIVILPFLAGSSNGISAISPIISTYSSEPSTLCAHLGSSAMSNFNVRLGVNNVFQSNIQYGYENYLQYFRSQGAINGGITNGISNGLISQSAWEQGAYGYRVVDLTVKNKANDLASQQITVQFQNNSGKTMDYIVLCYFEKNILIDTERGIIPQIN